jgi:solute carrier family 25 carnitine/acylcarnitine transporter 20/29
VMAEEAKKSGKATGPTPNMFETMNYIYENDGVQGFFGGVRAMMVGQAFIKAVAFCVNDSAVTYLEKTQGRHVDELTIFIAAACFSGFVTSFVTAPAERIKIIMQANGKDLYENDWDCFTTVLRNEGVGGLFSRGLGTTLLRDTPSYGLYFAVYHVLMSQTQIVHMLGDVLAPISFGAFSGCLSWIPIYPIDVVKVS